MGPDPLELLRRRVVVAVRRTCPASLAEQAEDIVQNVMVQLVASGRAGEGKPDLSPTYLAKAAYGVAVDEIRRRCRRREDHVEDPRGLNGFAGSTPGPEQAAASREVARGIQDCLEHLVRARRVAVTLYLEGCSVPESAGLLRWSEKKTENLVYRGLAGPVGWWRRPWVPIATAAAVLIVAAGLVIQQRYLTRQQRAEYRAPVHTCAASLVPEGQPLPRGDCVLRWSACPDGTAYDVRVTTEDLEIVARARELSLAEFVVPEESLRSVPSGGRILWQVTAHLPDGGVSESPGYSVEVR